MLSKRNAWFTSGLFLVFAGSATVGFLQSTANCQSQPDSQQAPASARPWQGFPTLSPFEAVRWRADVPEVRVQGTWYELLALNGLTARQIVDARKRLDRGLWQKRFEEDLVEVLVRTGHDPGTRAKLQVKELASGKTLVLNEVAMTEANRQALWKARNEGPAR